MKNDIRREDFVMLFVEEEIEYCREKELQYVESAVNESS
jgi:hypothetical protein